MILRTALSIAVTAMIVCLLFPMGCSGHRGDSVLPENNPLTPSPGKEAQSERMLWGLWQFSYDESTGELTPIPLREAYVHFNVTPILLPPNCNDCIKIKVNSFDTVTRILDADVTLRNPTPITGYDVRGILYTDDYGHELRNADDWTGLWDIAGGQTINPFKAFAKSVEYRASAPGFEDTEKYLMYIPIPPHWEKITFAADASWPGNCKEPYEITNFVQEPLYDMVGSKANISVDVHDWQDDVNKVTLVAPEITGEDYTEFSLPTADTWHLELINSMGAPQGTYVCLMIASSTGSGVLTLNDYISIQITEPQLNPVDVTPEWLNFSPEDVCVDGDYAYIAGGVNGLHIFDISNPSNPLWINWVDTPGQAKGVAVSGGYAYVADGWGELQIIDMDPMDSAHIVKTVDTPGIAYAVAVSGGYAYEVGWASELEIIDIDPPESAYVVKTVAIPTPGYGVAISGGYAYVANGSKGLQIIDIDPLDSAHVVKNVKTKGYAKDVVVSGAYAYVAGDGGGEVYGAFQIIYINPPESPLIIKTIEDFSVGLAVSDGYAYLADKNSGLRIFDVDPPDSTHTVKTVKTPGYAKAVAVSGGYAYVADRDAGLQVVDITSPESAYIAKAVDTPGNLRDVAVSGGYVYAAESDLGSLQIISIDPPGLAHVVKSVDASMYARNVTVSGGYAYLSCGQNDLDIFDIDPIDSAHLLKHLDTFGGAEGLAVSGAYAFLATNLEGLQIIDIDPPESAFIAFTLDTPGNAMGITVSGGYAYLADGEDGLQIIDIDPPLPAYIAKSVYLSNARAVAVSGGYAYVGGEAYYEDGFHVVDIDPLDSAHIVKTFGQLDIDDVVVSGGYAYVADDYEGFVIIDIDPLDSAYLFKTVKTPDGALGVAVSGGYAYVAGGVGGLRIIKLW